MLNAEIIKAIWNQQNNVKTVWYYFANFILLNIRKSAINKLIKLLKIILDKSKITQNLFPNQFKETKLLVKQLTFKQQKFTKMMIVILMIVMKMNKI